MSLDRLTADEREVVRQALAALRQGRLLDEDDIGTRIGATPEAYDALLSAWPAVDDGDDASTTALVVNNALNEVCNGVRISDGEWARWFTVPRETVRRVLRRWRTLRGWTDGDG